MEIRGVSGNKSTDFNKAYKVQENVKVTKSEENNNSLSEKKIMKKKLEMLLVK